MQFNVTNNGTTTGIILKPAYKPPESRWHHIHLSGTFNSGTINVEQATLQNVLDFQPVAGATDFTENTSRAILLTPGANIRTNTVNTGGSPSVTVTIT